MKLDVIFSNVIIYFLMDKLMYLDILHQKVYIHIHRKITSLKDIQI